MFPVLRRTEQAGGGLGLTGCPGAQNGLGGGWGLQNAAGVPPRVSPILRLRPGAGAVGRGAAANYYILHLVKFYDCVLRDDVCFLLDENDRGLSSCS